MRLAGRVPVEKAAGSLLPFLAYNLGTTLAHVKCLTCAAKSEAARPCAESIDLWDLADFLFRNSRMAGSLWDPCLFCIKLQLRALAACWVLWLTARAGVWVAAWLLTA